MARFLQTRRSSIATARPATTRGCKAGNLVLDGVDVAAVQDNPELWEKVVRKLRGGLMPPAGSPRPDEATYQRFLATLQERLDARGRAQPNPGRTEIVHRLNRLEYRERHPRSARRRDRRRRPAARRRFELRLRQHRRRAEDVAGADGALPGRGARRSAGSRSAARRRRGGRRSTACRRRCSSTSGTTACRSARAAARSSATSSRVTRSTTSRSTSPAAAAAAATAPARDHASTACR